MSTSPPPPRIALATCSSLPDWEIDDRFLHAALERRRVPFEQPAWDADVDWARFDAVLIRTTWDYQERLRDFVTWAHGVAARTRLLNPFPVVQWNARKTYLRDLATAGLPTIPTRWLDARDVVAATLAGDPEALLAALRELSSTAPRGFLKPQVGATAWGTLPFDADAAGAERAASHLAEWLPREGVGGMMLQPFVPSVGAFGETSVIFVDGEPAHGVRKVPVPGDYRVQDDHGASDEPWAPPSVALDVARRAMAVAERRTGGEPDGPLLYGRVDFLRDEDAAKAGDPHDGWRIVELELIEPSLFLRHSAETAERLADALLARLGAATPG